MRRRHQFRDYGLQMLQSLRHCERVHFLSRTFSRFQRPLQIVPGDFDGERISNDLAFPILVFHPSWTRQRYPHRPAIDQKFDIHRIGVPCGNGHDKRLINAVDFPFGPAVDRVEILIHKKTIADGTAGGQTRC